LSLRLLKMEDNQINSLKSMSALSSNIAFPNLVSLDVMGNPFMPRVIYTYCMKFDSNDKEKYPIVSLLMKEFPNIKHLNGFNLDL